MVEINRDVVVYSAGILDGEGWIGLRKDYTLVIEVTNTYLDLLVWLKEHWGGTVHAKPVSVGVKGGTRCKPLFKWYLTGGRAFAVVELVAPFLIVKKRQALKVLQLKDILYQKDVHHPEKNIVWRAMRRKVYEEVKILNRKGATAQDRKEAFSRVEPVRKREPLFQSELEWTN